MDKCFQYMMTSASPTVVSKLITQYSSEGYIPLIGYPYQCDDKYNYYKVPTYNYAIELNKKKAKKA
ncbi:unnamed protein product [Soboliphyme baturini]|uniref:ATE_C domain-containing protein n=1 Tax=Soboliphyme baturini TaxID=241478 RepID=A0A183IN44_9BILA|nr:unnamed protein product [Soboliphyme baturini]